MKRRLIVAAAAAALVASGAARAADRPPAADPEAKADFQFVWTTPDPSPTWRSASGWALSLYGIERLDLLHDSTSSFRDAPNATLARPGSADAAGRWGLSADGSRYGLKIAGPAGAPARLTFLTEIAAAPSDPAGPDGLWGLYPRHLYLAVQTPVVDVLVGRTHDLFGWGGKGFFAASGAPLSVPGEIFRQRAQVRLSRVVRFEPVDLEIALAGAAPARDGQRGTDGELGVRLSVNRWVGAAAQGAGPAMTRPLQVGLSTIGRRLEINGFAAQPDPLLERNAGGLALDVFVPLIRARPDDFAHALSATVELSTGRGVADLYPGLTGGAANPSLPNPQQATPPPIYDESVAPRLAVFDTEGGLHVVAWRGFMANLQYHLPFARGRRAWLAATVSGASSSNLGAATPLSSRGDVWTKSRFASLDAFVAIWRGLELAASFQVTRQTFLDGIEAENRRGQLVVAYYF